MLLCCYLQGIIAKSEIPRLLFPLPLPYFPLPSPLLPAKVLSGTSNNEKLAHIISFDEYEGKEDQEGRKYWTSREFEEEGEKRLWYQALYPTKETPSFLIFTSGSTGIPKGLYLLCLSFDIFLPSLSLIAPAPLFAPFFLSFLLFLSPVHTS
jgi:hypothetical protein